jgi:hypothetical protein
MLSEPDCTRAFLKLGRELPNLTFHDLLQYAPRDRRLRPLREPCRPSKRALVKGILG